MKYEKGMVIEYEGKHKTISQWARELGIKHKTIRQRIKAGWDIKDAFTKSTEVNKLTLNGESLTILEWSKKLGISTGALHARLARGWPLEKALSQPRTPNGLRLTHNKKTLTIKQWAKVAGINPHALYMRVVKLKWPFEKALTTPLRVAEELEPMEIGPASHFGQKLSPSAYDS